MVSPNNMSVFLIYKGFLQSLCRQSHNNHFIRFYFMPQTINRIYWIVHPAVPVAVNDKNFRINPKEAADFIERKIMPVIERAAKEPQSLVVFVRSPWEYLMERSAEPGFSTARIRKMIGIEKKLEKTLGKSLGNRAVVPFDPNFLEHPTETAGKMIEAKGFVVSKNALVRGYGAYREICPERFPRMFAQGLGLKRVPSVSKPGTVSLHSLAQRKQKKRG